MVCPKLAIFLGAFGLCNASLGKRQYAGGDSGDTTPFRLKVITEGVCDNRYIDYSHIGAAINAAVVVEGGLENEGAVFNFTGPVGEQGINLPNAQSIPYTWGYDSLTGSESLV